MLRNPILYLVLSITLLLRVSVSLAQCPTLTLDKQSYKVTIDDFTQLLNNKVITAATYVNVDASLGCFWDLHAELVSFNANPYTLSATQGSFGLGNVDIRAVNICETANHDYGAGSGCINPDPNRIHNSFCGFFPFNVAGNDYIVGNLGADLLTAKAPAPCAGTNINSIGDANNNPTTHRFRIDFELDFSAFPGAVITPGFYELNINFVATEDAAGVFNDIENFTLEIEIQQIQQLKMNTNSEIQFDFTDVSQYSAGITKYGSTILEVSSNMNWDLIAVGTSTRNDAAAGNPFWDNFVTFSAGGTVDIPLDALELHQSPANPFGGDDYSAAFISPPVALGTNNIEVARGGITPVPEPPSTGAKTIAGNWDLALGGGNFMAPGSYKVPSAFWNIADFRYVIDYKLTPGLPSSFSNGTPAMPTYARPGSYGMQVRYILTEDQ